MARLHAMPLQLRADGCGCSCERTLEIMTPENVENEPLESEVEHILEESRMILPGIQALFGFQLIAVFSERFAVGVTPAGQRIHLAALVLVALAMAIIMAPAAYHRQAERGTVSRKFADYASRLITIALAPLLISISLEVALVSFLVTSNLAFSVGVGSALMCAFAWLWFIIPNRKRSSRVRTPS